jgi:hypothetical protein
MDEEQPRESEARDEALLEAQVRVLKDTLADYRVLKVEQLEQLSGATDWNPGVFREALDAGVRRGVFSRRGDDFVELPPEGS